MKVGRGKEKSRLRGMTLSCVLTVAELQIVIQGVRWGLLRVLHSDSDFSPTRASGPLKSLRRV